ncbi:MAG TPA: M56 family metallopeptidase [Steroidobacteraceae bacterium]|jgi:beta-lactamase regulating signal transducer with metallopeptidase domain|nr:M56 family metallopeptidase [Steroidobacteraceae bacterium]
MIAAWMAYALVIALLVSIAAFAAERIAILRRLQGRWIWVSALLLSLMLPTLFGWQGARPSERTAVTLAMLAAREEPPVYELSPIAWVGGAAPLVARRVALDTWLLIGWSAMSALAVATLAIGWTQIRRRLRSSVEGEVNDVKVTISHDIGPAVVGIVRPRIVIPRWLLQQDAATQKVVLEHEREHLRAQDVRVLGAALLVAVLVPWNLPIWWQLRRLRFAMEVDCDARVVRGGQSRATYSAVLLNVATHLVPLRAAAAGLSESGSSLEKRIRIMHTPLRARWRVLAALLGTCSAALIAVAANVNAPPVPSLTPSESEDGLPPLPTPVAVWKEDQALLARAVGHFYPQLLSTRQDGHPYVWAVVNERGEVSQIEMNVRPTWDREYDFARNWQEYLERAGVVESEVRQQLVLQLPIGPNYSAVAWVMLPGAPAQDPAAPTFTVAPRQAQAMEARMLATAESQRRVIEHFDATALSEGVPSGQELWFLIDSEGKPLRAGRRTTITDPQAARLAMKQLFPELSVGYITRGTVVKDATGKRVPVSWQWLEKVSQPAAP